MTTTDAIPFGTFQLFALVEFVQRHVEKRANAGLAEERAQAAYGEQATEPLSFEFKSTLGAK